MTQNHRICDEPFRSPVSDRNEIFWVRCTDCTDWFKTREPDRVTRCASCLVSEVV